MACHRFHYDQLNVEGVGFEKLVENVKKKNGIHWLCNKFSQAWYVHVSCFIVKLKKWMGIFFGGGGVIP